jgi:hypothetical protein
MSWETEESYRHFRKREMLTLNQKEDHEGSDAVD